MTRSRVKALHKKVTSLLSMCDLDTPLNGLLLHSSRKDEQEKVQDDGEDDQEKTPKDGQGEEEGGKDRRAGLPAGPG